MVLASSPLWLGHRWRGDTFDVEASRVHAKRRGLQLAAKVGEVTRESAEIGCSYVASHADAP